MNVALLGYGRIGKKYFKTSLNNKNITINKILKKRKTNLKIPKVKIFRNFNLLSKDKNISAYIVATPVKSHYEYANKIVKKNKPFILEKPIVANNEELQNLYKLCKNYKKSIFINHIDLYNPAFLTFLKNLKSIGTYKKIEITYGKYQKIKKPKTINEKKDFFLPSFDWLAHPLSLSIKLAGLPKKISILRNKIFIKKKYIYQESKIKLNCKKKIVYIYFSNNYAVPKRRVKIRGSKSTLIYDGYKKNKLIKIDYNKISKNISFSKIQPMENFLQKFISSIKNKSNINQINFGFTVAKILFKIENKMKRSASFKL